MKPNWNDAPEWANYYARDKDNTEFWYECEPTLEDDCWAARAKRWTKSPNIPELSHWTDSLERRP